MESAWLLLTLLVGLAAPSLAALGSTQTDRALETGLSGAGLGGWSVGFAWASGASAAVAAAHASPHS